MRRRAAMWINRLTLAIASVSTLVAGTTVAAQNFDMTEAQFNQWLTNGRGSPNDFLEIELAGRLARLDHTCKLTDQQRRQMELAGHGDIARFESEVAELRDKLVGKSYDQQQINEVYQQVSPLAQRLREGILDQGSLFAKVRDGTLDDLQRTEYQRLEAERNQFLYEAKVKLFVTALDGNAPMLDAQRQALLALLFKETRPPKRWRLDTYDWYYVLFQASQLPRVRLQEILDDAQLRCFDAAVNQAARYGAVLEREGMVPVDAKPTGEDRAGSSGAAEEPEFPVELQGDAP